MVCIQIELIMDEGGGPNGCMLKFPFIDQKLNHLICQNSTQQEEITMIKKIFSLAFLAFFILASGYAFAGKGKPNFSPSVYADGVVWGTKATTEIPAPNDHNLNSYDILYVITNGHIDQLPVGDAGPRNRNYNGGRWFVHTAEWTEQALIDMGELPLITSYEELMGHPASHIIITPGSPAPPPDGPPDYFQCPLLPVKAWE